MKILGRTILNDHQPYTLDRETLFLVFFRISIALLVLVHFLSIYNDIPYLYGDKAFIPNEVTDLYNPEYQISTYKLMQYLNMQSEIFWNYYTVLFLVFSLFLAMGFITQLSAFMLLMLHLALMKSNSFLNYGVDYYANIFLFFLCILPSNLEFSLDRLLFTKTIKKWKSRVDTYVLRNLLKVFVCISYFFSGFDKLLGFNWRNGESIWKTFTLPYANLDFNLSIEWISNYTWILIAMGWFVIIIELCYPLINIKALRKYWLAAIITMHLGIALILNLYFFSAIMIIINLTAYYDFTQNKSQKQWRLFRFKVVPQ